MMMNLTHEFVKTIPEQLKDGVIYVSINYATVIHKCCCGCGNQVVTPLSPTDWKLTFDGKTISLSPSIGNWSFPCQSHYWITNDEVRWATKWSRQQIKDGTRSDEMNKKEYYKVPGWRSFLKSLLGKNKKLF